MSWWLRRLGVEPSQAPPPMSDDPSGEYTRPATWEDVLQTARLLKREQVRYGLVRTPKHGANAAVACELGRGGGAAPTGRVAALLFR